MGILSFFLDIFFPQECVGCGQAGTWFCEECFKKVILVNSPTCPLCQQITLQGQFCSRCRPKTSLTGIMVAAYYESPLKEAIHTYKYEYVQDLAKPLANLLINHLQKVSLPPGSGHLLVAPVPLHHSRLRQRGFNQAALLAQEVAKTFGLKYQEDILSRVRKTRPQIELSQKARQENVKGAFSCLRPELVQGKNILLVDDVCTTGATLNECASELRKAQARQIWGLVLARQ